jgi:hypothetical protein
MTWVAIEAAARRLAYDFEQTRQLAEWRSAAGPSLRGLGPKSRLSHPCVRYQFGTSSHLARAVARSRRAARCAACARAQPTVPNVNIQRGFSTAVGAAKRTVKFKARLAAIGNHSQSNLRPVEPEGGFCVLPNLAGLPPVEAPRQATGGRLGLTLQYHGTRDIMRRSRRRIVVDKPLAATVRAASPTLAGPLPR